MYIYIYIYTRARARAPLDAHSPRSPSHCAIESVHDLLATLSPPSSPSHGGAGASASSSSGLSSALASVGSMLSLRAAGGASFSLDELEKEVALTSTVALHT